MKLHQSRYSRPALSGGWPEWQAGFAGMLLSLGPALALGLIAFAALGSQAASLGIPAALVSSAVGGAVFAWLGRGPMPAGGPSATPVLVVGALVARVVADPDFTATDPAALAMLLALVATAVVTMGALQIVLGLSGLLRLTKFVPQPVLAGFMNGVALLAFLALLPLLLGWPVDALHAGNWNGWPAPQLATVGIGLFTMAVILGLPRLKQGLPVTLIGILAGTLAYLGVQAAFPQTALGPLTGSLPMAWPHLDTLAPLFNSSHAPMLQRHGGVALTTGLVMALIGSLELVLNGLAMDQACHTRTDPRPEVLALGVANLAAGLVGGLPLLFLRPRALRMRAAGGRTRASLLICSALFAVLGLLGPALLAWLPQVVLAAIMAINAWLMADRWSLGLVSQWWRGPRSADLQLALGVMVLVCTTTLVLGFPAAVAAGALLSVLLFIRSMNRSLVRARFSGAALPSRRIYAAPDEQRLQALRARITVLELEGALFFGSADRLVEVADALDSACHTLVLDFRRISLIDASGAVVLVQLSRRLHDRGIALLLAGVGKDNRHGRMLSQFAGEHFAGAFGAADVDQAMEAAELRLLLQSGHHPLRETVPIEQTSLMAGLDDARCARLAACLQTRRLQAGEVLFRRGDPGDRLYVLTSGSINVFSGEPPAGDSLPQRFVSLSPGMMLGETAMLDGLGRSGDAVAFAESIVHALDISSLQRLGDDDPQMQAQIYRNIALHLSQRLRAAALAWRASTT